ncbi:MAG: beta-lactamase family protein [Flavobacteriaceae bacterium]|nr:beta-lactamase family protein [Flavobacteriaceae bacterium]
MKKNLTPLLALLLVIFTLSTKAQIDSIANQKIDSLFKIWNVPDHPGGAVAIMSKGKTVFSKAYGLASLEYLVPNSTGTIFNTGSVSKQFTAMGIVRLEEQGKLNFDDDIHKYIPDLPAFQETITIRHLLHHTSGLRSLHAMLELAGWRGDDSRSNADLNRIIVKQKDLNFKPGSEYLYCNTGYMLMVNIIENISGEKFKDWMQHNIFIPLDMPHTYVEDQYNRVVPDNATSYYGNTTFDRAVEFWGYVGSGNMHSTTGDLLNWLSNFSTPKEGWKSAFETLQTTDKLNDGSDNNYAFGVVVDEHLGKKRIQHGGAIGGFRSYVATYPDAQLSIAVLTNFSGGNPVNLANQIAGILFGRNDGEAQKKKAYSYIELTDQDLMKFEGTYWNDKDKYSRKIYLKNDTLRYSRGENNETPLIPINQNTFKMLNTDSDVTVTFINGNSKKQMLVQVDDQSIINFETVNSRAAKARELAQYAGTYYSPELETSYTILVKVDTISVYHPRHGYIAAKLLFPDIISADWPVNIIQIKRNAKNKISGMLVSNGRVRNAWFEKQ